MEKFNETVEQVLVQPSVGKAQEIIKHRSAPWLLGGISFVESFLPIPIITDPFLIAAILLDRTRTGFFILLTIITSVLGGLAAYMTAWLAFDFVQSFMTEAMLEEFNQLLVTQDSSVLLLTLLGAITPIPHTLVAWMVAVLEGSVWVFLLGSLIGRTVRYAIVGYSVYRFGPLAVTYARRYIGLTTILLIIIAAFVLWLKL